MIAVPIGYDSTPHQPPIGGSVVVGWAEIIARMLHARPPVRALAVDGPVIAPWQVLHRELARSAATLGRRVRFAPAADGLLPPAKVAALTTSLTLADDPDFEGIPAVALADLFEAPVRREPGTPDEVLTVITGPGAALSDADVVGYLDLPKRYAEAAVSEGSGTNLGLPDLGATSRRLYYVDWPLLDRHRDAIAHRVAWWIDAQDPQRPTALAVDVLRATADRIARRPFRTRPTFNSAPWGGQWGRRELGMGSHQPNTALGYELIAPESGVLIGHSPDAVVELPLQLLVTLHPVEILGHAVHEQFGTSFPIRFDYLDTVDGGNLSVHCHPLQAYMREVFGWPYTQHETYYVMLAGPDSRIFLGLRDTDEIDAFHRAATEADELGEPFDITRYVQSFPALQHQLYLIPAGTPHGSGEGNVVLEISATPYLYSLRFYDWLRRDHRQRQRPVHVGHAFDNLDPARSGEAVRRQLVPEPLLEASGDGWYEELLGTLPDMFFDVRRITLAPGAGSLVTTTDRFHLLNVVAGEGVVVETGPSHRFPVRYAETVVIPAAVGQYRLVARGTRPVRVIKAHVR